MNIFLIGVNGIGMQGISALATQLGHSVFGFDDFGEKLDNLLNLNIKYTDNIPEGTDLVVFSSAIKSDHFLLKQAQLLNILCINRTDFLINYVNFENPILVAGAHGKTTTASMLAHILDMKSYMLGGVIIGKKFPAHISPKDSDIKFSAVETDESDGSFLKWRSKYRILLNFDFEHMDHFNTEENCIKQHQQFVLEDIENSIVIVEHAAFKSLNFDKHPNIITFGSEFDADYTFSSLKFQENGVKVKINNSKEIYIPLFGAHNVSNFTAIYAMFDKLEKLNELHKIATFPGIKKRMQEITKKNGFTIFSDYGHHPNEVKAVLNAFFLHKKKLPHVVLEPHKFSRTQYTWDMWPAALKHHKIFVMPIYSASQTPISGVTTENFVKMLQDNQIDATFLSNFNEYDAKEDTICFSAGYLSSILGKY